MGIMEFFKNLFDLIFSGSSPEADKRRRLREISNLLKGMNPTYIDPVADEMMPGFASVLFKLYRGTRPLKQIIDKTICNEDSKLAQRFWDDLIEVRLPESYREKRVQLTYEEIKKRIVASANAELELKKVKNEIDDLLSVVSDIDEVSFNDGCNNLVKLANVCQFDFRSLLIQFDRNFDGISKDYKPSFKAVAGNDVLTPIMDLYYIAADLRLSDEVELNLTNLLNRFQRSKVGSFGETMKRALQLTRESTEQYLSTENMANLIRLISKDPDLDPKKEQVLRDYLAEFKKRFRGRVDRSVERVTRELDESMIAMDLSALFRNAELLEIESYNEGTSNLLLQNDLEGFTHIKAMQIVKSFILMKFENDLKEVIKKILVDGFFEDKMFQQSMSASVFECENALTAIAQFEKGLQDDEKLSVTEVKKNLQLLKLGKNVTGRLNKLVEAIDTKAGEIVETATNSYSKLHTIMGEVLNDYKLRAPVRVSNIKVLGGSNNSEMIKLLLDRQSDIDRFINIMRHFTVVQTEMLTKKHDQTEA